MIPRLDSISISDFRSINGTITVPLNAPVVLVHGPNGAGKTSVLSAIELALTGEIIAMQRSDPNYRSHLIHRGARQSRLLLNGAGFEPLSKLPHENLIKSDGIIGGAFLPQDVARFFSERCYLAQATLGRLLEIYQNADARQESALTRFVKDLLGLDTLDALIDGLHPAADVRNTRRLSPGYANAEKTIRALEQRLSSHRAKLSELLKEATKRRSLVNAALTNLLPTPNQADGTGLPGDVEATLTRDDDERQIITLKGHLRDLNSVRERAVLLSESAESHDEATALTEEGAARVDANAWRLASGKVLEDIIAQLRATFPNLPSVASTDPDTAFQTSFSRIEMELQRCSRAILDDDALLVQSDMLAQVIAKSRARIALADEQIASIVSEGEGLSHVLASLIPYIRDNDCPVCGRDYREVSSEPLIQHVSSQVARLTEQSDRLQTLGRSRSSSVSELSTAERDHVAANGKRLSQEARGALKARIAMLTDAKRRLLDISQSVVTGANVIRREAEALRKLANVRNRNRLTADIRTSLNDLCAVLLQPTLDATESISDCVQRLNAYAAGQYSTAIDQQRRRREALAQYRLLREQESEIEILQRNFSAEQALKKRWDEAYSAAEDRRLMAKSVARAATIARTAIVGRVFNSSLNTIWHDLFVRLAPTEPFVPAFRVPQSSAEQLTTQLETIHREGGTAGAPGAMLSAGNLNTAALTLFIALHLSVEAQLPWLILDDPVQSMDEVHIAQFAALLRTLSKEHHRQIVIAVHERALFEYLTLELSPAFPGDQLITVELSRTAEGSSVAEPKFHTWEPDPAIAAA